MFFHRKIEVDGVEVPKKDIRWRRPVFSGYMTKQSKVMKTWRRRFFVLTDDGRLWYFKNKKTVIPEKPIPVFVKGMKIWKWEKKPYAIKIERHPKNFFFFGDSENIRHQWISKFIEVGGIMCEYSEVTKYFSNIKDKPEISTKDVKNWNIKDVHTWLSYLHFSKEQFSIYTDTVFSKTNGKKLLLMTKSDLEELDVINVSHLHQLHEEIQELQKYRTFNYPEYIVRKKIRSQISPNDRNYNGSDNWRFISKALSDPGTMLRTYLLPNISNKKLTELIEEKGIIDKNSTIEDCEKKEEERLFQIRNSYGYIDEEEEEEKEWDIFNQHRDRLVLPIRLMLTEMRSSVKCRTAKTMFGPVFKDFPKQFSEQFGFFRTSIIIGPFHLEWDESSLCVPKRWHSDLARIQCDIDASMTLKNTTFEKISKIIAKNVCLWNSSMMYRNDFMLDIMKCGYNKERGYLFYDKIRFPEFKFNDLSESYKIFLMTVHCVFEKINLISKDVIDHMIIPFISEYSVVMDWKERSSIENKKAEAGENLLIGHQQQPHKKNEGNCQEFIEELMDNLQLYLAKEGSFGRFLETIKDCGFAEMEFIPSKTFKEKFELKIDRYVFITHRELDDFLYELSRIDEIALRFDFRSEEKLLKSFDRAFWYRSYRNPDDERWKRSERKCPFDNPNKSHGYWTMYT